MFIIFWNNVGDPPCFPTPLPDCLCDVSFSRYSPLSLEVVEKPNKFKVVWRPFFQGGRPRLFYGRFLARLTDHRLAKFGWAPFAAKPGNEVECRIYGGWVKTGVQFEAVCGPKFMLFCDDIGDSLQFATHLTDCLHCVSKKFPPLNSL